MKKGFTLIELLIVVAIIGILAAVGAAVIPGLLENAKRTATQSNHASIVKFIKTSLLRCETGEKLYLKKENGILDTANVCDSVSKTNTGDLEHKFEGHFIGEQWKNPYTGKTVTFSCPGPPDELKKGCTSIGGQTIPVKAISIQTWWMNSENKVESSKTKIPVND